jgi:hypothetical protein
MKQIARPSVKLLMRAFPYVPVRFDDVKRLNALNDLDGDWGCRPLRMLLYKLSKKGD